MSEYVGRELEPSEWFHVDQAAIDSFADATRDRQGIHVDPVAAESSQFGTTIAHGLFMLSLVSHWLFEQMVVPEGTEVFINYGFDRVRFISPVKVNSFVRLHTTMRDVRSKDGGILVKIEMTLEIRGEERPGMAAEMLMLLIPQKGSLEN